MMNTERYEIECPQCKERQDVALCQSINTSEHPELKEQLLKNQINIAECPNCNFKFRIDAPLFYNDGKLNIAILCIPVPHGTSGSDEILFQERIQALQAVINKDIDASQVHVVLSHSELVERVFILEAGMDVRVVEYIKYLMHSRNLEKLDPSKKRLLFNAQDSTEEKLLFIVQDLDTRALEGILEYKRDAYNAFEAMFDQDDFTPDLFELFPGPHISARQTMLAEDACLQ